MKFTKLTTEQKRLIENAGFARALAREALPTDEEVIDAILSTPTHFLSVSNGTTTNTNPITFGKSTSDTCMKIQIFGSYTGLSFVVEGSMDGTAWPGLAVVRDDSNAVINGGVAISPSDGQALGVRLISPELYPNIRVRPTAISGGTLNAYFKSDQLTSLANSLSVSIANQLTTAEKNTAITTVGAGTLTAAALIGQVITRTGPVAAYTDTTDTAALIIAAIPTATINQSWEVTIKNNTAFAQTLAGGTGVTLSGQTVIPANSQGRFLITLTSLTAVSMLGLWIVSPPSSGTSPEINTAITTAGAGTLSAAAIAGGYITRSGPTAAYSDATDTAANIIAAVPNAQIGESWELTMINTVAFFQTVTAGAGVTLSGLAAVISPNSTSRWLVTYTGAGAVTMQLALVSYNNTAANFFVESAVSGLTAFAGGGQGSATLLTSQTNRVTVVATRGDSVKLPVSIAGLEIVVINTGAQAMAVFPQTGDTINGLAANASVLQMANSIDVYSCAVAGAWHVEAGGGYSGPFLCELSEDTITAFAGGGQASARLLTSQTSRITTVATAGDSIKLPVSAPGLELMVINHGANSMQVYGSGTDTIDDVATATGVPQMVNSLVIYTCATAGAWYSEGLASGFAGPGLQSLSFTAGITAFAGGGQASAVALTSMINRLGTVATQGDSVRLPASNPGMTVAIINRGAQACQVFGASTDTINGIATATGISQGINTTATYVCTVAGNWEVPLPSLVSSTPLAIGTAAPALPPHVSHTYVFNRAGVVAATLAAPTAGTDDGLTIVITSDTANAHTLTATNLLDTGSANQSVATFAAQKGAGLTLMAFNGRWKVLSQIGITFS